MKVKSKQGTYDNSQILDEHAVLVCVTSSGDRTPMFDYRVQELTALAESAGVGVKGVLTQKRESFDPKWIIGKGKVEELKQQLHETESNVVIFDHDMSGMQLRNLEQSLDVKIIDRTQLILDIFAGRANTREGKLQVELAQLNYLLPRLSGHGVHLSRLGGGIGTRGPGETKLETDRRHINRRIHDLRSQLDEVKRHRMMLRERRQKNDVFQAALVGYTNAGKSTLLDRLTSADAYAENRLFATLDTMSRKLDLPGRQTVMLTDTVGFIQNLPHDLVAAFRSTLEETVEADVLIHVVDSSSPMWREQMDVVYQVLRDLGAYPKNEIVLFNKIDQCPASQLRQLTVPGQSLRISAFHEADLTKVKLAVEDQLLGSSITYRIPVSRGDLLSQIYRIGEVHDRRLEEEEWLITVRVNPKKYEMWKKGLESYAETNAGE